MKTEPLVSVLLPVYNAGEYLRPSVQSILSQTYSNLEILIIDDGSTDGCMDTITSLEDSRIRIISQKNSGKAVALNRALEELSGEFYAIQDADDISYPQRIERQVECMLDNPKLAAVFTGFNMILRGQCVAPWLASKSVEECRRGIEEMRIPTNDAVGMFRVSMVRNIRYEPTLRIGQGVDYILRVGERYPMMVLGGCFYSHRVHLDSTIRRDPVRTKQMIRKVLMRACERRGLNPAECLPAKSSAPAAKYRYMEQEIGIVPHFMESVLDLRRTNRNREALKTAFACLRLHPYDPYYYKPLAYSLAPLVLISYYRSRKSNVR